MSEPVVAPITIDAERAKAVRAARSVVGKQTRLVSKELKQLADVMSNATDALAATLAGVQSGTTGQRDALKVLVEQLLEATRQDSTEAEASGIREYSERSESTISNLVSVIQKVQESSGDLSHHFSSMSTNVDAVVKLLNEVNDITSQTDLSALNAAIEAARAGLLVADSQSSRTKLGSSRNAPTSLVTRFANSSIRPTGLSTILSIQSMRLATLTCRKSPLRATMSKKCGTIFAACIRCSRRNLN